MLDPAGGAEATEVNYSTTLASVRGDDVGGHTGSMTHARCGMPWAFLHLSIPAGTTTADQPNLISYSVAAVRD